MNKEVKEIIGKIKYQYGLTQGEIATTIGVKPTYLSDVVNKRVPFTDSLRGNLLGKFPNITSKSEQNSGNLPVAQYEVLLLPISAQGGSLSNFAESVSAEQCERIVSPIKDVSFAMSVTGDSMEPEYPSGSKILIKKINERAFIEWGRCYVLDTCNGTVVKKLMPSDDPEKLKCVSTNTEYPPFEVYLTDVFGVYRVLMMLSEK